MTFMDVKFLIMAQIGIDILIVVFFIFLIKRLRYFYKSNFLDKELGGLSSLLTDVRNISESFQGQLEEKQRLIKSLNSQLENRIASLNALVERADVLLARVPRPDENKSYGNDKEKEIIGLAGQGHKPEAIASMLSIPKTEVKLVLDLRNKISNQADK